ncbi:Hypothetical protein A7982_02702 [Minicystis rosea]|nr:Hypothetical protein A7982_02702 [Minicystis rosea]
MRGMMRFISVPRASVLAGAILAASLTAACSSSTPPPADPASAVPTFGANDLPPGTKVLVARQGQWLPAAIVQPLAEGRFLVHYDNTGNEWNEVVGPDRIKSTGGGAAANDYKPGDKVLVTFQGRLMLADVVMQAGADAWRVHYDGWGPEASEQVGPDRIRRPFTGPSGHAIGEAVMVEVNGQTVAGKVIAASAADRWLVRFESFGPQYDQEVGVDRIRAATPAVVAPPVAAPPPPPAAEPPPPPPAKDAKAEKGKGDKDKGEKGKKAAAGDPAPAPQSGPPAAGEAVLVNVRGAWFPATVGAAAGGGFKVKFGAGGEEEIPADRVLREPASLKGLRYQVGQQVLVHYKGVFVAGKVIKQEGKDYKVRFEGTGPEEDEVVQIKRLRPR